MLLIVRHGSTPWSAQGRFTGHADVPLCEKGLADAAVAAERVTERLARTRARAPAYLLSSDLRRAIATARVIAARLGVNVRADPALREEHLGPWEGATHADVASHFPREYESWRQGRSDAFAGREGLDQVAARAAAAVHRALSDASRIAPRGSPVVVVTHANTALALVGHLTSTDRRAWAWLPPPGNGGVIECRRGAGHSSWSLTEVVGAPAG